MFNLIKFFENSHECNRRRTCIIKKEEMKRRWQYDANKSYISSFWFTSSLFCIWLTESQVCFMLSSTLPNYIRGANIQLLHSAVRAERLISCLILIQIFNYFVSSRMKCHFIDFKDSSTSTVETNLANLIENDKSIRFEEYYIVIPLGLIRRIQIRRMQIHNLSNRHQEARSNLWIRVYLYIFAL